MSIDLYNEKFLLQKLNYLPASLPALGMAGRHSKKSMPSKWDSLAHPCDYLYSSAKSYYYRENSFEILQHYAEI